MTAGPEFFDEQLTYEQLLQRNRDQAVAIAGLTAALRITREEMADMRRRHLEQLMKWRQPERRKAT